MVLKIKLGKDKEERLKKHLEKEHPSTKGKTSIEDNDFSTDKQARRIVESVPNIKCQAQEATQI